MRKVLVRAKGPLAMTAPHRYLRRTLVQACSLAEQGRIMKGYNELLEGLDQARRSPQWREELKALWYAAIEIYEDQWFPEEWLPLVKQRSAQLAPHAW